jgi:hypothetical protein
MAFDLEPARNPGRMAGQQIRWRAKHSPEGRDSWYNAIRHRKTFFPQMRNPTSAASAIRVTPDLSAFAPLRERGAGKHGKACDHQ